MSTQSIFRIVKNKNNPYVMIGRDTLADKSLSWKAKGILAYLLSLPDDWTLHPQEIQHHATNGRDSLYSGIKELIERKYIRRTEKRNSLGQIEKYEYIVYEKPYTGNPNTAKPNTEKPYNTNKNNTKEEEITHGVSAKRRLNVGSDASFGLKEPSSFYKTYSLKLIKVVENRRVQKGKIVLHQWESILRKLHTIDGISKKDIKKTILWYVDNWRSRYVSKIYLAKDVRDKWQGLIDAMKREAGEVDEPPRQRIETIDHGDGTFTKKIYDL